MTQILTKHDEIRQWAIARTGNPALGDAPSNVAPPILRIVFGQEALNAADCQAWTFVDRQIDPVLRAVRAGTPDATQEEQAINALLTTLSAA